MSTPARHNDKKADKTTSIQSPAEDNSTKKRKSIAIIDLIDSPPAKKQATSSASHGKEVAVSSGGGNSNSNIVGKYGGRDHIDRERTPGRDGPIKEERHDCEPDIKPFKGEKGHKVRKTHWEKEEEYRQFAFENEGHTFHE